MERWKEYISDKKKEHEHKILEALTDSFQVNERNGKLYLVIHDVAFAVVEDATSAVDIVSKLNEARNAAIAYKQDEEV